MQLNKPIPDDLVPILAKDEEKQKQIREKATKDASSTHARTIGVNSVLNPTPNNNRPVVAQSSSAKPVVGSGKAVVAAQPGTAKAAPPAAKPAAPVKPPVVEASKPSSGKGSINMVIQAIPPFKGSKPQGRPSPSIVANGNSQSSSSTNTPMPTSPTAAARLNVNASSFRPNPKANAFSPVIIHRVDVTFYYLLFTLYLF